MIAQFALRLVCGMSLTWCLMPRSRVTSGFFRIQMLVALGLSVLASLTLGRYTGRAPAETPGQIPLVLCFALAVSAFLGSIAWTLERRRGGTLFAFAVAALSLTPLLLISWHSGPSTAAMWLRPINELTAAALLGTAVSGMLLGHWYLTAPTMSIAPLHSVTWMYTAAALCRTAACALGIALVWNRLDGPSHAIWLSLRLIAGILGPLATAAMTLRILKFRNTQAATGVLFVGVILVFIGEMTAALLSEDLASPL